MTIQELIDELSKITDKSKEIGTVFDHYMCPITGIGYTKDGREVLTIDNNYAIESMLTIQYIDERIKKTYYRPFFDWEIRQVLDFYNGDGDKAYWCLIGYRRLEDHYTYLLGGSDELLTQTDIRRKMWEERIQYTTDFKKIINGENPKYIVLAKK